MWGLTQPGLSFCPFWLSRILSWDGSKTSWGAKHEYQIREKKHKISASHLTIKAPLWQTKVCAFSLHLKISTLWDFSILNKNSGEHSQGVGEGCPPSPCRQWPERPGVIPPWASSPSYCNHITSEVVFTSHPLPPHSQVSPSEDATHLLDLRVPSHWILIHPLTRDSSCTSQKSS